jgi:hypothetical protein
MCKEGSVGVGCASCTTDSTPRWYSFRGDCLECPAAGVGALELAVGCAVTGVIVAVVYRIAEVKPELDEQSIGLLVSFIPIVYSHLQITSWAITLPSFGFPDWLVDLVAHLASCATAGLEPHH